MNTKTISPFASIRYNLWKDSRQILTVLLAVIGGITLIQLTFLAARFLVEGPMTWNSLIETTLTLAGVGSLLTIIGSAAMMIGHERQTGTWGWASSLPTSWAQTLASKLIVSFASSVLVGLALCCIPLVVYTLCNSDISFSLPDSNYFLTASVAVFFQAWAFFFLATLVFKDPMTGMVCASILAVLVQTVTGVWSIEYRVTESSTLILVQATISLLAFGSMIGVYRWRWRLGQHSEFSLRRANVSYVVPAKAVYIVNNPSEWRMLLSLSAQNMLVFRVLLAVSSTLFLAWLSSQLPAQGIVFIGLILAMVSLGFGLTAFMGDQANGRFRFMADRGVNPMAMVTSRLAVPWCLLVLCLFTSQLLSIGPVLVLPNGVPKYWSSLSVELLFVWCLIVCSCFSVGALASLCFRQPIIACFSAGLVSSITAILYGLLSDSIHGDWDLSWIWMNALVWMIFVPFLLLSVTYRFARKWIVFERVNLFLGFTAICGCSMFLPLFLSATFSFWMVPWHAELLERSVNFTDSSVHEATKWMRAKADVDALRGIRSDSRTAIGSSVTRPLLAIYPPIRWRLEREAIQRAVGANTTNRSNFKR
jgi:hypothetical protein